jgi:phosphotransferase system  glucose/maltose/N-acetylglucosamine-specific IIC component
MAKRGFTAGVFGVVVFVTSLTSRDGWVTAVVVGLIASLLWFVLFPWVFRKRR